MKYYVKLHRSEGGFSVSCPGLPGCWSQGTTEQEAMETIGDAIAEYLDAAKALVAAAELRQVEVPAYCRAFPV